MEKDLVAELLSTAGSVFMAGKRGSYCMGWFEPGHARVRIDGGWLTVASEACRIQLPLSSLHSLRVLRESSEGEADDNLTVQFLDLRQQPRFSVLLPRDMGADDNALLQRIRAAERKSAKRAE